MSCSTSISPRKKVKVVQKLEFSPQAGKKSFEIWKKLNPEGKVILVFSCERVVYKIKKVLILGYFRIWRAIRRPVGILERAGHVRSDHAALFPVYWDLCRLRNGVLADLTHPWFPRGELVPVFRRYHHFEVRPVSKWALCAACSSRNGSTTPRVSAILMFSKPKKLTHENGWACLHTRWRPSHRGHPLITARIQYLFLRGLFQNPDFDFLFQGELRCENAHSTSSHLKEVEQVGDQWNVSKTKQSMKKLTRARHDLGSTLETACLL